MQFTLSVGLSIIILKYKIKRKVPCFYPNIIEYLFLIQTNFLDFFALLPIDVVKKNRKVRRWQNIISKGPS